MFRPPLGFGILQPPKLSHLAGDDLFSTTGQAQFLDLPIEPTNFGIRVICPPCVSATGDCQDFQFGRAVGGFTPLFRSRGHQTGRTQTPIAIAAKGWLSWRSRKAFFAGIVIILHGSIITDSPDHSLVRQERLPVHYTAGQIL